MSYDALAAHAGSSYLRYSFTRGTDQEVGFLVAALGLRPGDLVLDAGCGPGRHARALADRGIRVAGIDRAEPFVRIAAATAPPGAWFARADVRALPLRPGSFDAVVCLCQGGFGLLGGGAEEGAALAAMAAVLRPGGRLALSACSAYYTVRWHAREAGEPGPGESFTAASGVYRETARVRGEGGGPEAEFELCTTCFTPRELRLLAAAAGLEVDGVWSVEPGRYSRREPEVDLPEWLMVAARPGDTLVRG